MAYTSGTATDYHDLLDDLRAWLVGTAGWTQKAWTAATEEATGVAINTAGTGYAVDDVITLTGGTFVTAAQLTVTSIGGSGDITGVNITEPGEYSATPSNPVSGTVAPPGGSGADFTMTWSTIMDSVAELQMEGPGMVGGGKVYINIQTDSDVGNSMYSWRIYGATAYEAGVGFGSLPGAGGPCFFNLWQNTIDYWFYANDRRFIVVAQVSTSYMSMYAGNFLPFALPSEYPYPLAIIASYPEMETADVNNARNSMIADPGAQGAAWYRRRTTETWVEIENQRSSVGSIAPSTGQRPFIFPHKTGRTQSAGTGINPDYWGPDGFHTMKLNANNEAPLIQCHIIDLDDFTAVGGLEGVFSVTGFNRSTEQQLTVGGRTFKLFQRAFRSQPGDFFAVEEV